VRLFLAVPFLLALSAQASLWRHLTDYTEISSLVVHEEGLAAACSRGAVLFSPGAESEWTHLSLADGMRSLDQLDVCADGLGNLFWAGQDLSISALALDGSPSRGFMDFAEHGQISRLNDLFGADGAVLVSHSLGLTRFSYQAATDEFLVDWNLYSIADFPLQTEVLAACAHEGELLVITAQGAAIGSGYPERPVNWTRLSEGTYPGAVTQAVVDHSANSFHLAVKDADGELWFGHWDGNAVTVENLTTDDRELLGLTAAGDRWALLLADDQTSHLFRSGITGALELEGRMSAACFLAGELWLARSPGTLSGGLLSVSASGEVEEHVPNVPSAEEFVDLDVAADGSLWAVGVAANTARNGLYHMVDGEWDAWLPGTGIMGNYPTSLACDPEGGVWFGTWGKGLGRYLPATGDVSRFSWDSPAGQQIVGFRNNQVGEGASFPLVSDVELDAQGNVWVVNHQALDDSCLVVVPSAWFDNPQEPFGRAHYSQAGVRFPYWVHRGVDGSVWAGIAGKDARDETKRVLRFRSMGNSPSLLRNWQDEVFTLSSELYNFGFESIGYISGFASDAEDNLWIATTNGFYQGGVYGGVAQFSRVLFLEGLVNENLGSLAMDGRGRVWLGSSSGLNVYDPRVAAFEDPVVASDLQDLLRSQSGITVNEVVIHPQTGEVWAATNVGFFVCDTGALDYGSSPAGSVQIYPNPFRPDGSNRAFVKVQGLANDARMAVFSLDGRVLRELDLLEIERGWDGRDTSGQLLDPGVYLLLVTSSGGSAEGKVAIIR
jgi:ligand-binding sensor domain-containing protein